MNIDTHLGKIKKFITEWKWAFILISICIAGIPLMTFFGIQSVNWGNDFWPNAFSEFLGMFVDLIFGALFTFVVIDKYIQYHKNYQWRKIKNITYKNLYFTLSNILLKLNNAFPSGMRVESYILTEDFETLNDYLPKEDLEIVINSLTQNLNQLIQEQHSYQIATSEPSIEPNSFVDEKIHTALVKFKLHTKSDITAISSLIIPKLLNFSDDPILLDNVIELEELFTSLMSKINNIHRKNAIKNNEIKYIWITKVQEILSKVKILTDFLKNEIDVD